MAGSFVVPTTMIGAAPSATIGSRTPVGGYGQSVHGFTPNQYGATVGAFSSSVFRASAISSGVDSLG